MAICCWASLPSDLVNRITDCFLTTNDIDYYMDFRAVCRDWRYATDEPKNTWDPRFRPRSWIIFEVEHISTVRLFVNTATGRFLHKDMPILHKYYRQATSEGGFMVLSDIHKSSAGHVLNPFTGHLVRFMSSFSVWNEVEDFAAVFGSPPKLVLCSWYKVFIADPQGELAVVRMDPICRPLIWQAISSGVYDLLGCPVSEDSVLRVFSHDHIWTFAYRDCGFFVESAEEILMIAKPETGGMVVFKVDMERKTIEPVKSIGDHRAIFIGHHRCFSVNASKFPSIDGNCIYYIETVDACPHHQVYMYDMTKGQKERVYGDIETTGSRHHPPSPIRHTIRHLPVLPMHDD